MRQFVRKTYAVIKKYLCISQLTAARLTIIILIVWRYRKDNGVLSAALFALWKELTP